MHPRLELASRFWPDVLETSARASLRTTLHELRRALGEDAVIADREPVGLAGEPWVDALAVRALAAEGRAEEALALCAGDALPGLDRDWAIAARDEHRELVAGLLAGLRRRGVAARRRCAGRASSSAPTRCPRTPPAGSCACSPRPETAPPRSPRTPGWRTACGASCASCRRAGRASWSRRSARRARAKPAARGAVGRRTTARPPRAVLAARPARRPRRASSPRIRALIAPGRLRARSPASPASARRGCSPSSPTARAYGRCYEESLTPYQPFVEALGEVMPRGRRRGRAVAAVRGRSARGWRASVLLLDDLHWADAGTLRLLAHVLRRPDRPGRASAAYRDSEISRMHPLAATLADLRRDGLIERVALHGLDEPTRCAELARRHDRRAHAAARDRRQPVLRRGGAAPPRRRRRPRARSRRA